MIQHIMRQLFQFLFILVVLVSCESKSHRKDNAGENNKNDIKREPLDTSVISLRSFKTVATDDLLSQDWNMDDADQTHWNDFFWDSVDNKRKYPGLCLFRDFTFTENARAGIKTGKWDLDKMNRQILLNFTGGEKRIYYVQQLSINAITFVWRKKEDSAILKFSSDNIIHKQVENDPFYYENNKWRIKPPISESNAQIRERLKECVHFYALFFKDNRLRRSTDISFIGLPCCFEWYNGGISIPKAIELDRRWKDCFYSEDQAYRGYDMLKTFLETHTLKWPSRKIGWVGQTQSVLEQIHDSL